MSKIFEYVIFYQLFDYMCTNNLLTIEQFGFRTGHSTELTAIQLIDHLTKQIDMGKVPTNIYIDLSKAFDTLEHSILLDKLTYYGVCGLENLLLRDYISVFFGIISIYFLYVSYHFILEFISVFTCSSQWP